MAKILLKNIYHLYQGEGMEELTGADLLIHGNRIEAVAEEIPAENVQRVIDCSSHVVIPGLINTHHHFFQTLTRNIPAVQNAKLFDWLLHLYEIWKHIDPEAVYYSSLLAMGELLKTGCTATTDHHYLYPEGFSGDIMALQFEAARSLGMRFSPTRGSMSLSKKDGGLPPDSVVQTEEHILEDSLRVIEAYHDPDELSMQRIILAPCSPFSVTPELMKETARLARSHQVRLHTHLAETEDENEFCRQMFSTRPLGLMERCEFIGNDVSYVHGIHFNDEELKLLSRTKTHIAHCPSSNMRLGSGICRIREMIDLGVPAALAVDGSASNDSSDMLGEVRQAMLLQRVKYGSGALTAREALALAVKGGADLLGFPRLGKLMPGYGADIAVFDVSTLGYAGSQSDPLASLLFTGFCHSASYTIVNGRIAVDDGKLTGIDEQEIAVNANAASKALMEASV